MCQVQDENEGLMAYEMLHNLKLTVMPKYIYLNSKCREELILSAKRPLFPNGPEIEIRFERNAIFQTNQVVCILK